MPLAEAAIKFVIVPDVIRPTVADRSETVREPTPNRVTVADVNVKLSIVALVALSVVIVADVLVN